MVIFEGSILFGGVCRVSGNSHLGSGHSSDIQVLVTMKEGRSCVISGPVKVVSVLLWAGREVAGSVGGWSFSNALQR